MYNCLTECSVPSGLPRSCDEVYHRGSTQSGNYTIAPDVSGCTDPFIVECDMTTQPPTTIMVHNIDQEVSVRGYRYVGSYKKYIKYTYGSANQIRHVVQNSKRCSIFYQETSKRSRMTGYTFWETYTGLMEHDLTGSSDNLCRGKGQCIIQLYTHICNYTDYLPFIQR